jgi:hypothetical protein
MLMASRNHVKLAHALQTLGGTPSYAPAGNSSPPYYTNAILWGLTAFWTYNNVEQEKGGGGTTRIQKDIGEEE